MIGFDIGGTKCAVITGVEENGALRILKKQVMPTDHSAPAEKIIEKMCLMAEEMTDDFSRTGISCGGPLDANTGVILSPPNLPGWDNVRITEMIQKRWGGKAKLQNDADACALAEWKYGAGKGCNNLIFLTFGTGMGAGLILNGQLYSGANGMAGEVGHIRLAETGPVGYGKAGSFEGFCSGGGLAGLGRTYAKEKFEEGKTVSFCKNENELSGITAKLIAECADKGSADALEIYRICGEKLGQGLSVIIDILNPEMIIIGSIYERSGHLLKSSMMNVIERETLLLSRQACRIVPATLADAIGDYAALSVAATI